MVRYLEDHECFIIILKITKTSIFLINTKLIDSFIFRLSNFKINHIEMSLRYIRFGFTVLYEKTTTEDIFGSLLKFYDLLDMHITGLQISQLDFFSLVP